MSCPHIVWALNEGRVRKLTSTARLVLMVVAEYANGALMCWPSVQTLSDNTGLNARTVQKALRALEAKDLIRTEERPHLTSIYHVKRPLEDKGEPGSPPAVVHPKVNVVHPNKTDEQPDEWLETGHFSQFCAETWGETDSSGGMNHIQGGGESGSWWGESGSPDSLSRRKKESAAPLRAEVIHQGVRQRLFSDGVPALRRLTGKTDGAVRGMIGKLCQDANDDCARVLAKIQEAEDVEPADPFPWLRNAVRNSCGKGNISTVTGRPVVMLNTRL